MGGFGGGSPATQRGYTPSNWGYLHIINILAFNR